MTAAVFAPIVIEGFVVPVSLSPNRAKGRHWGTLTKLKRPVQYVIALHLNLARWPAQVEHGPRRRLTVTTWRRRRLDADNETATLKVLIDCVRTSGALWNDSPRYLELVVLQEIGRDRTTLELEEIGG